VGGSPAQTRPELLPLLAVKRPAVKDSILGAWSVFTMTFEHADDPSGALLFGGDLIVPGIGASAEVGIGVGLDGSFTKPRFAIDAGLVRGIGLSFHGLVSHQLDLGALFLIGNDLDVTLRLSNRTSLEAGDWLLRLDLGPTFDVDRAEFGLYAGLGMSRVMS